MSTQTLRPKAVRFGDFVLDVRSGELIRNGQRLLLSEQPFRALALLVRHPGTLVTRDDLRRELWPEHTFVDFEHGLNAAVKRLRGALGDSGATPRFIETLPRGGLRRRGRPSQDRTSEARNRKVLLGPGLALRSLYVQTHWVEESAFKLVQRGSLDADRLRARLDFEWFIPSGRTWRHVRETLRRIQSNPAFRSALKRAARLPRGRRQA